MKKINPELNPGDRIILLHMEDPYPTPNFGELGTVIKKVIVLGVVGYEINWDNGSKLSIWSDIDTWSYAPEKLKNIKESNDNLISNPPKEIFKNYNMLFLHKYLEVFRQTGLTNIYEAAPYLYIGKDKLEKELEYKENTEPIIELLSLADKSQSIMIDGAIRRLEKLNKPIDLENINRIIKRDAPTILKLFIQSH